MKRNKKMKRGEFHQFVDEPCRMALYAELASDQIRDTVNQWPDNKVEVPAELRDRQERIAHLGLTFAESMRQFADDLAKLSPKAK